MTTGTLEAIAELIRGVADAEEGAPNVSLGTTQRIEVSTADDHEQVIGLLVWDDDDGWLFEAAP